MAPLLICEDLVSRFKFWFDGQVQDGMHHRNELFRCLRTQTVHGRQQIYDLGWALSQEGVHTVITASKNHYTLWVNLKSLTTAEDGVEMGSLNLTVNQCLTCGVSA